jgi:biotin synthase-related radical SAM superfamily protein
VASPPPEANRINVSIGTAAVLGLADVPMAAAPTTAYLMLGGRCLMNCAFCAQARESTTSGLAQAAARGDIRRACLQVTVTAAAFELSLAILRTIKAAAHPAAEALPFDIAILPHNLDQVRQLLDAGADHIGFGLDAACERVFCQVKGGNWARSLALVKDTARAFPGRAALHLIVGLGETEKEMVERIQWAHDLGVTVGLFAFTPVPGTHLAGHPPPPLAVYRRLQAARWLISHGQARAGDMAFDAQGRLVNLSASLPGSGGPFRTSGCPDCNRPYYNERPGGVM